MQEYIVFLLCVQCRRKESSRSSSHLLMSFLFLVCHQSSSVGLMHARLHAAVMICAILINTQRQLLTDYTISSAS